ncbi:leucine-rich repeat domain-containing protein [Bacillus cereus]|uniref:leucine-rich repeat domain-containing protein n=1 Tax=Bacillus cereus TaxID=1396 RepID=UPI0020D287AD|nr:leucine-rich repeat domain-containing protein [Bacillus cereus]
MGEGAFQFSPALSKLYLPKVERIGYGAFTHNQLKEVSLRKVEYIGEYVFVNNPELEKVLLPNVTYLEYEVFLGTSLKSLSLPSIKEMDSSALRGSQLQYVIFPKSSIEGIKEAFEQSKDVLGIGFNSDETNQISARVGDKVSLDIPVLNNSSGMG